MADQELLNYIRVSLEKGHSRASITSSLKKSGWSSSEIESAFQGISHENVPPIPSHARNNVSHGNEGTGFHARFFRLQDGEKIQFETKPKRGLLWYMFVKSILGLLIFFFFFGLWLIAPLLLIVLYASSGQGAIGWLVLGLSIFFGILILDIVLVKRRYDMRYYWITNNRIVVKRGLIGYSINSIPLERVSDVLISRSFLERIFGFGSLHIQTLAGQYSPGGRRGSEGNLQALPDPEENQALVFDLIKKRRKSEHLTM